MQRVEKVIEKIRSSTIYRNVVYYTTFYYDKFTAIMRKIYNKLSNYTVDVYRYILRKIHPHYQRYIKPHIDTYVVPIFERITEFLRPYYIQYIRPLQRKLQPILVKINRPVTYWSIAAIVILGWGPIHFYFANPERLFNQVETGYQQSSALYTALTDTRSTFSSTNETSAEFNVNELESSLDKTDFNPPNSFFMNYAFDDLPQFDQELETLESVNPQTIRQNLVDDLAQFERLYSTVQPLLTVNEESLEVTAISRNIGQVKSQPGINTETITDKQVRVVVDAMSAELSEFYVSRDRLALQIRIIELRTELATELENQWLALFNHHLIDVSALESTYERMFFYLQPHVEET